MRKATAQPEGLPRMLSRAEVSRLLGVSDNTLRRMIRAGELPRPLTLPGGSHRYLESEIRAFQERLIEIRDLAGQQAGS